MKKVDPKPIRHTSGILQGPSPDEVALVDGARRLGFEFLARNRTHISLRMQGHAVRPHAGHRQGCLGTCCLHAAYL